MIKEYNKIVKCNSDESKNIIIELEKEGWNLLASFRRDNSQKELRFGKSEWIKEDESKVKIYFNCGDVEERIIEESEINKLVSKESNYINYWKVEKLINEKYQVIFEEKAPKGWKQLDWSNAMKNIGEEIPMFN